MAGAPASSRADRSPRGRVRDEPRLLLRRRRRSGMGVQLHRAWTSLGCGTHPGVSPDVLAAGPLSRYHDWRGYALYPEQGRQGDLRFDGARALYRDGPFGEYEREGDRHGVLASPAERRHPRGTGRRSVSLLLAAHATLRTAVAPRVVHHADPQPAPVRASRAAAFFRPG